MRLLQTVVVIGLLGAALFGLAMARPAFDAALGTSNELKGGTLEKGFDTNAVKPYESQGKITGKIQNKTGQVMNDVVISISASAPAGSVPPHITGGSVGNASIGDGGDRNTFRVELGSGVEDGTSLDITINVGAPNLSGTPPKTEATDFKVKITPSAARPGGLEYDVVEAYAFTTGRTIIGNGVGVHAHNAIGMFIKNEDAGSPAQRITQIAGTMTFPSGSGLSLSSATVFDSPTGSAASGVTTTINSGTTFTITGLALLSGGSKYLILEFSDTPLDATTLSMQANFRE